MLEELLQTAKNELFNGLQKKGHPFRYFVVATETGKTPSTRTVVLRNVEEDFTITFYTDKRTPKVEEVLKNPNVALLFFDSENLLQIRIWGKAELIEDKVRLQNTWKSIPQASKKDYLTLFAPGSETNNPSKVSYKETSSNFCIINVIAEKIEYLKLKRPNHIRASFERKDEQWEGRFLIP